MMFFSPPLPLFIHTRTLILYFPLFKINTHTHPGFVGGLDQYLAAITLPQTGSSVHVAPYFANYSTEVVCCSFLFLSLTLYRALSPALSVSLSHTHTLTSMPDFPHEHIDPHRNRQQRSGTQKSMCRHMSSFMSVHASPFMKCTSVVVYEVYMCGYVLFFLLSVHVLFCLAHLTLSPSFCSQALLSKDLVVIVWVDGASPGLDTQMRVCTFYTLPNHTHTPHHAHTETHTSLSIYLYLSLPLYFYLYLSISISLSVSISLYLSLFHKSRSWRA